MPQCKSCHHKHKGGWGGGQASLNSSSLCWKTSRYHWQAQGWEINIYSKLPQITSRDFSPCLFLSVLSSSLLLGFRPSLCLLCAFLNSCFSSFFLCSLWSLVLHLCIVSLILCQPNTARQGRVRVGAHVDVKHRSCFHWNTKKPPKRSKPIHKHAHHTHTHAGSFGDIHLGFVMSDMAHVSLFCNYGSIYFFRSSRWVRSVP